MNTLLDFNLAPKINHLEKQLDPVRAFRRFMGENGYVIQEEPVADGKWHRFGLKNSEWYIFNADPFTGSFGSWKTGEALNWSSKSESSMSTDELARYRYEVDRQRQIQAEERVALAAEARAKAAKVWAAATPLEKHPYLEKKRVLALGTRLYKGCVLVPIFDVKGEIQTYETINVDGEKRFLTGGAKKGNFYTIPGEGKVAVAEGFSTAASIHMATGWTVLVAFDAGNMIPVAETYREAHSTAEMVICGDNDHAKERNVGKEKAEEAAKRVGAKVLLPKGMAGSDWNDLHVEKGLDAVKSQLFAVSNYSVRLTDWGVEKFLGTPPDRKFLVNMTIPSGSVFVLAAMGDAGKGMLTLDLAIKVANTPTMKWSRLDFNQPPCSFGNEIASGGPVVIFTAEDDKDEVHRRFHAIGGKQTLHPLYIIPLPDAGGPMPLVVPGTNGPQTTPLWHEICEQLDAIGPALIVIDPMASFVMADINRDPSVGAYTMGLLAMLGKRTGAAIIICHHLAKTSVAITTPEQARGLVRGTSAIVDNSRATYVLWQVDEKTAKSVCQLVEVPWKRNRVFRGCLVKSNGPGDREIKTFIRNDVGLLEVRNCEIADKKKTNKPHLYHLLAEAIAMAATSRGPTTGQPFTHRGKGSGVFDRRKEMPPELQKVQKRDLERMVEDLIEQGVIVKCSIGSSKVKNHLDIPNGPFARGEGEFAAGA